MKFAYADPPYHKLGKKLYAPHHPEANIWDDKQTHIELIHRSQTNTQTDGHYHATQETSHGYSHTYQKTPASEAGAKHGIKSAQHQPNSHGKQSYGAPPKKTQNAP